MRRIRRPSIPDGTPGRLLLVSLAAGWLLGSAIQIEVRLRTGMMPTDVNLLFLAALLCLGSGTAARLVAPSRTARTGALAGMAMAWSIVAGYFVLMFAMWNPAWGDGGGETPVSLLIEAPFWFGLPSVAAAALGGLGWQLPLALRSHEGQKRSHA